MSAMHSSAVRISVGLCALFPVLSGAGESLPPAGERWEVTTLVEYYGPKDRAPSKTNRETKTVCLKAGSLNLSAAINTELPAQLSRRCNLGERRADESRQQVKYICTNGATAEAATRREPDGSFSSQIVANLPQEWAVSIMRNVRPVDGACDATVASPALPDPPPPVQSGK